jgi:hypothetical protein
MDVASGPRSRHGHESPAAAGWSSARIVGTLVIVLALGLLVLLVGLIDLLPQAPASEPVLSGPFRWQT